MTRLLALSISLALLVGCAAAPPRVTIIGPPPASPTNLALGRTPLATALAERMPPRGSWGRAFTGLRVEDVSTFQDVIVDDQFFYDELGGTYRRERVSIRSGVQVR